MNKALLTKLIAAAALAGTLPLLSARPPAGGGNTAPPSPPHPDEVATHLMSQFDRDNDGKLDLFELATSVRTYQHSHPRGPKPPHRDRDRDPAPE